MLILLTITMPHKPFNTYVRDGSAGKKMERILEAQKPQAVYFTDSHGCRSCVMIVDLPDASKIPALVEPWFLTFEADVDIRVVMRPEDLKQSGLDEVGKKWG